MASASEENLHCPVCCGIFQDPVLLSCSHSFCKACLQTWWNNTKNQECPLCRKRSVQNNPPKNLALRNVCQDFLQKKQRDVTSPESHCSLHAEELKLFCLNDEQPVCVVCLHSETHKNHSIRPIDEAARDIKEGLQEQLEPLRNKLDLFNDMKENYGQTAKDIEGQAEDTERQIKATFSMLRNILEKEEKARLDALKEEEQQKSEMMRTQCEALAKEMEALSDTIRGTNEVLRATDHSFLLRYNTAVELVHCFMLNHPQPIQGAMIDVDKHLKNLPFNILERMKMTITHTLIHRPADPEPTAISLGGLSIQT
ncbi:E3 ubiquitin-protein ligase TRIM35-like [Channa argus]|uniref:E3 ubiquitin-protein ligase TRIM35-like n=1 Tax=Channa argus TaxID=215402 RepID=UPI0035229DFA